jgi:hypothetical protein
MAMMSALDFSKALNICRTLCKKKEAKDAVEIQATQKKFGTDVEMWS